MKVQNFKLKTLLLFCIVSLALMVALFSVKGFLDALSDKSKVSLAKIENEEVNDLLESASNWAVERGMVNAALNSSKKASEQVKNTIKERRKKGDEAFNKALKSIEETDYEGYLTKYVKQAEKAYKTVEKYRSMADSEISKSGTKASEVTKKWFGAMSDLIILSQDLRYAAGAHMATMDSKLSSHMEFEHAAWIMSEYADRERAMVGGIIGTRVAMSTEELEFLSNYRGKVEAGWDMVKHHYGHISYQPLKDEIDSTDNKFFSEYESLREAVYKAGHIDGDYPVSSEEWISAATSAIDSILDVQRRSSEYTVKYLDKRSKEVQKNLILDLIYLLFAVVLSAFSLFIITSKVVKPINNMSSSMSKLADNNVDIEIPEQSENEIGMMAKALVGLRRSVSDNLLMQKMTSDYPVVRCDSNFSIVFVNDAAERELSKVSVSTSNVLDRDISHFSSELSSNKASYRKASNLPLTERISINGQWLDIVVNHIETDGEFDGVYLNISNVTEIVKNDESVKKAQGEIQTLIDGAYEGILDNRIDAEQFQGFYRDLANGLNGLMDAIVAPINVSIKTLTSLSSGDLASKMEGNFSGSFGDIQESLNGTIEKLRDLVTKILDTAGMVASSSEEISSGSADLSRRTESQASNLEETAATMEEMTASVTESAHHSENATNLAEDTKRVAKKGEMAVNKTIDSISLIQESSKKIAEIVGVIDEIAFQTNLLALNAAVEAARAGDVGKGFAVVADEVRALAGRSSASSKEIKDLILESVEKVQDGVKVAQESGQDLKGIIESVDKLANIVLGISASSKEQEQGIKGVNEAMTQLDQMTQQNASMVEEGTASATALKGQAQELKELIQFFKL